MGQGSHGELFWMKWVDGLYKCLSWHCYIPSTLWGKNISKVITVTPLSMEFIFCSMFARRNIFTMWPLKNYWKFPTLFQLFYLCVFQPDGTLYTVMLRTRCQSYTPSTLAPIQNCLPPTGAVTLVYYILHHSSNEKKIKKIHFFFFSIPLYI